MTPSSSAFIVAAARRGSGCVLLAAALDKYSFARDAYLQRRQAQIFDSQKPDKFVKPPADSQGKEPDSDGKESDTDGQIPPLPENTAPAPAAAQPAAR
jgi:ABC-type transporter lipoprotein component MlaA